VEGLDDLGRRRLPRLGLAGSVGDEVLDDLDGRVEDLALEVDQGRDCARWLNLEIGRAQILAVEERERLRGGDGKVSSEPGSSRSRIGRREAETVASELTLTSKSFSRS
jgi:hypothetical protein